MNIEERSVFPKVDPMKPLQQLAKIGLLHPKEKAMSEVPSSVLAEMGVPVNTGNAAQQNPSKRLLLGANRGLTIRSS